MKFAAIVGHADDPNKTWLEHYDKPNIRSLEDASKWMQQTVDNFNATLRPTEHARRFIDISEVKP